MPHDKRGTELQVGDTVMVPCKVKAIHLTENYCNVDLVTAISMPPDRDNYQAMTLNSRQTIKPTASHRFADYPAPVIGTDDHSAQRSEPLDSERSAREKNLQISALTPLERSALNDS